MSESDECNCPQCGCNNPEHNPAKGTEAGRKARRAIAEKLNAQGIDTAKFKVEKVDEDKFASLRREPTFKVLSRHEVIMKHREGQVMNRTKGGATVKKIEPERMKGGPEIIKKV